MSESHPRFLIVDDDRDLSDTLASFLRAKFPGAGVLTAASGEEALDVVRTEGVDVIISDHNLGAMDGVTFLAAARNITPTTIRILITGATDLAVAIRAVNESRIHAFLAKPFDNRELFTTIERFLSEQSVVSNQQRAFAKALSLSRAIPRPFSGPLRSEDATPATTEILVVDDVPEITAFFKTLGERLSKDAARMTTVNDAREAVRLIGTRNFDVVVSDYHMPHASGAHVLAASAAQRPSARRILITAYNQIPTEQLELARAKVDAYLHKPIRAQETLILLEAALSSDPHAMDHYRTQARALEQAGDFGAVE